MIVIQSSGASVIVAYHSAVGTAAQWRIVLTWNDLALTKTVDLPNFTAYTHWNEYTITSVDEVDEDLALGLVYMNEQGHVQAVLQAYVGGEWVDKLSDELNIPEPLPYE